MREYGDLNPGPQLPESCMILLHHIPKFKIFIMNLVFNLLFKFIVIHLIIIIISVIKYNYVKCKNKNREVISHGLKT
jgi:hypothetical protein